MSILNPTLHQQLPYLQCEYKEMPMTTVTFRVDETLKKQAAELFESLGMNLSQAINLFLKQAVEDGCFPLVVNDEAIDIKKANEDILALFGSAKDLDASKIEDQFPEPMDIDL